MWKKRGWRLDVDHSAEASLFNFANGTVVLAKATPDDYEVISSFKIPHAGDRPGWSHPIIADGKLYVRYEDTIRCYDIKSRAALK